MPPITPIFGRRLYRILSSYSLAHFYFLHYFGLDCGLLEFFRYSITYEPSSKNKMYSSCNFGDYFGGKDCVLCTYNPPAEEVGGLDGFLYEVAQNF
jgi:hypothetical protein